MNKFKNYSFLAGLISAVLMVVVQILSAFEIYISSEIVSNIVSVILGALVVLGVISKPDKTVQEESHELEKEVSNQKEKSELNKTNKNNQN